MLDKLRAIHDRFMHLEEQLSDPSIASDVDKFKKVNKDYKDLKPIVEAYHTYSRTLNELQQAPLSSQSCLEFKAAVRIMFQCHERESVESKVLSTFTICT